MNILFVSKDYTRWKNGGSVVSRRNLEFLKSLPDISVTEILIPHSKVSYIISLLTNDAYGSNWDLYYKFKKYLHQVDVVWFDGSLFGRWVKKAKSLNKFTICFCHNIELNYYTARYHSKKSYFNKFLLNYARKSESMSFKYADEIILLNDRDAHELNSIYQKKCNFILPTTFRFNKPEFNISDSKIKGPYVLFVGSNFFANAEGIDWYIKNVSPSIKYKTVIVGSICEAIQPSEINENIILVGIVDKLDPYYQNALAIISPIFSGSGTKTKTIEALSYSKTIIGTKEAFVGVPDNERSCILCADSADFIREINKLSKVNIINHESQKIFNENFSEEFVFNNFRKYWEDSIANGFHNKSQP